MITQDDIDKIQKLKARRYSQSRVAEKLEISVSTVARYWNTGKKPDGSKSTQKRYDFDDLFSVRKCEGCDLVYPMPKFLHSWNCPRCKETTNWKSCWYDKDSCKK